ncbi:SPOR domain-containing protein [Stakelama saccharophila]|uniref:SPOR domain-containing protein n=1 Tax=Stakelama saccharophila TaxID=3075605 RepID=A0ABZ0B5X0_9SPHN|nr:SPOR domain-containing protein [Stakelama sp. W311]WNO52637.1 SPOR domain-containing protein [Stakelama sp. W311]
MRTSITRQIAIAAGMAWFSLAPAAPAHADVKDGVAAWTRGDYTQAVAEWRKPAEQGDADAQFNLGQAYKLGRGVPVDFELAEQWYRKAALQGHEQAADNYGLALYQNGKHAAALPWLEKSVERGESRAEFVLGTMLFNGEAVQKDWALAYALVSRAAAAGLPQASRTLGEMDQYISLEQRQRGTELARTYERAAEGDAPIRIADTIHPLARPRPMTKTIAASADAAPAADDRAPAPSPAPEPAATSRPASRPTGRWRVQLGAFGQAGNARSLWRKIGNRVALFSNRSAFYETGGGLTRLQVGPFASRRQAENACDQVKAAGNACLVVRP